MDSSSTAESAEVRGYIDPLEVAGFVSWSTAQVAKFDSDIDLAVHDYESTLAQMFDMPAAELSGVSLYSTGDYFTFMRAGQTAKAAAVIRSFAFHRVVGALDLLCAYLVLLNLGAGWSVLRTEARLQRRARWRLRRPVAHATVSPKQIATARGSLRRRRKGILERFRGVARALLVAVVLVILFSALSAIVGKAMTLLLHNTWAGWLIGPIASALLALLVIRPLLKPRLEPRLKKASRALLINLLALMVFDADSSTRARLEGFLLTEPAADGT